MERLGGVKAHARFVETAKNCRYRIGGFKNYMRIHIFYFIACPYLLP